MASAINKKTCAKCNKGGGTAMCYGCEQAFCTKHFIEHRQELSQQMDNIGQEHDVLRRDLTQPQRTHPLLTRINEWEQESIIKIQTAAKKARDDLQQFLSEAKNNLKTSVNKMTEELQSSRESDDYTEIDIRKWTNQLQEYRKMLDSPSTIKIDYENDSQPVICMIKVNAEKSSSPLYQESRTTALIERMSTDTEISRSERFVNVSGEISLAENGLAARRLAESDDRYSVSGAGQYSSGKHHVRFRIEHLSDGNYIFFGIICTSQKLTKNMMYTRSCYGWWDFHYCVLGGQEKYKRENRTLETDDEVTFVLDCDNREIQLQHHRSKKVARMSIDLRVCAFPWTIIAILVGKNDCVRILP